MDLFADASGVGTTVIDQKALMMGSKRNGAGFLELEIPWEFKNETHKLYTRAMVVYVVYDGQPDAVVTRDRLFARRDA